MSREFRHITRIAETDLNGTLKVTHALLRIKGIGISMANAIVRKGGIDRKPALDSSQNKTWKNLKTS